MSVTQQVVILVAEDDPGHARLIEKNLNRAGLCNQIKRFGDGEDILNYLFRRGKGQVRPDNTPFLLLLDIKMPKMDGVQVLRRLKADSELRKIPAIMLATTDDPREVERCYALGCSNYIVKPLDYDKFAKAIEQIGYFVSLIQVPALQTAPDNTVPNPDKRSIRKRRKIIDDGFIVRDGCEARAGMGPGQSGLGPVVPEAERGAKDKKKE